MEDLARISFKKQPLYVGVDDTQVAATREGLEQGYCIVSSAQRFLLLFTFLKKNADKKVRCLADKSMTSFYKEEFTAPFMTCQGMMSGLVKVASSL